MHRLVHLGLCNAGFTDAVCEALPSAPGLRRLTRLDLSLGTMTRTGAAALLGNAGAFAHLEMLVLTENLLDESSVEALETLGPEVWLQDQRDAGRSAPVVACRDGGPCGASDKLSRQAVIVRAWRDDRTGWRGGASSPLTARASE